jgi:hypothetical protein
VLWQWGKDNRRVVMIPPRFCLVVVAPVYFRADIRVIKSNANNTSLTKIASNQDIAVAYEESLPMESGDFFAIFMPIVPDNIEKDLEYTLSVRLFKDNKAQESKSSILYLAKPDALSNSIALNSTFTRQEIMQDTSLKLLGFNRKGAMMRACAWWGRLESKYDALLAANINPDLPENRWILLTRYRIWAIYQGYSRELTLDCLERFTFYYNDNSLTDTKNNESSSFGKWLFNVPTSEGSYFQIEITLEMVPYINCTVMKIYRPSI